MEKMESDKLLRLALGLLLFRLGGEQSFSEAEIDFICEDVKCIQLSVTEDSKLLMRVRGDKAIISAAERGVFL